MRAGIYIHTIIAGLLVGIYAAKYTSVSPSIAMLVLYLSVVVALKLRRLVPVCFLMIGFCLAIYRTEPLLNGYAFLESKFDQKVELQASIITDPVYHDSGQYEFNVDRLHLYGERVDAVIRVRSYTNDVRRGDRVQLSGKLRDGFASWQASMYYAQLDLIAREDSVIESFRGRFIANVYSSVPDPEASLGLGFLMGIRALLPDQLNEQLATTGLTHIVAVSGYNLTILATASKRLLHRYSRFQAAVFTLMLMACFVVITGMSPSILRAVVVSVFSIGASYYGRKFSPWLLLAYSSSLSAIINPAYAWFGVGWYLSLTAFFGVLIIAPAAQKVLLRGRPPKMLTQIVFETSSAQMATLPIIMLIFGEISVVALLANILVLPLIPIAMVATFLGGVLYFVSLPLAGLAVLPSYIILQYITSVITALSRVSWALLEVSLGPLQALLAYVLLLVLYIGMRRKIIPI